MTLIQDENGTSTLSKKERVCLSGVLAVVGLLTVMDVYEDWFEGASLKHIIPEVVVIISTVGVALYLLRYVLRKREVETDSLRREVTLARESATNWQSKAFSLSRGITDAITEQFKHWALTEAEQEVSFLLIKGLSIKEISEVRETSERTVRQQASEVYRKSGLSGRAQLSAFFIEDLFERRNA